MSSIRALRNLEKENTKPANKGGIVEYVKGSWPVKRGVPFFKMTWKFSSKYLWMFSTTFLITLVPLSIEILREEQTNEVVKELLSNGFSPQQVMNMGYHVSAPDATLTSTSSD